MIKQLLAAIFILVSYGTFSQEIQEYAHILRFDGTYKVNKDCSMLITERITVYADGYYIDHGIYREIPLDYDYEGGQTTVDFSFVSAFRDGKKENYHTEREDNGIRIYFGDEDISLPEGFYTYEFTYKVNHVLRLLDNVDELYWNTNGNGWDFTVDTLTARVLLPPGIRFRMFTGYTGRQEESGEDYTVEQIAPNELLFETTRQLDSYENLTFAASWNKNQLIYPSASENFLYWIKCHVLWLFMLFMLIFLIIRGTLVWRKYGRDPKPGTIMPQYDAPEGFSPADVYAVMNQGRVLSIALTGQIASLGAKGWLKIKQEEREGSTMFTFSKEENPKKELTIGETSLYQAFFADKVGFSFYENSYSSTLSNGIDVLESDIKSRHRKKYEIINDRITNIQYLVFFLFILAAFGVKFLFGGAYYVIAIMGVLGFASNVVFSALFDQPTRKGRKIMDHILGLKLFIEYADKKRIQFNNPPDLNFETYERLLPYAIVLGLAKEWEGQFNPIEIQTGYGLPGYWFAGIGNYGLGSFNSSTLSSLVSYSSSPPSSSSGGFFSGGGGSSGG